MKPYVKPVSILLGLLAFLFFGDIAAPRFRVVDELFDFGHTVLFAAVAFAVFSCLKRRIHKNRRNICMFAYELKDKRVLFVDDIRLKR